MQLISFELKRLEKLKIFKVKLLNTFFVSENKKALYIFLNLKELLQF